MITLFHVTMAAASSQILKDGFVDNKGSYGRRRGQLVQVDLPVPANVEQIADGVMKGGGPKYPPRLPMELMAACPPLLLPAEKNSRKRPEHWQDREEASASDANNSHLDDTRPSVRQPEHQILARPCDRRVEQAGGADPVWQPTFDGGLDEARCQEGQRSRPTAG